MNNSQHYQIVECRRIEGLMNQVSNMIADGWIPTGGYSNPSTFVWCQTMWKPPLPEHVKITMNKMMEQD